ncbi:MAG: alpha/beta hydrolase [Lachnospiraceae bacterium]|jgi:pimeloyl-ACP methyl ester carboxylesterase|nr:alpha/beta hydrolase [Lachnospiraceae bacterium]
MGEFAFRGIGIHYEDYAAKYVTDERPPLLILNGIFMSCGSWTSFIPAFAKYSRLLLLDFPDQGKSGRMGGEYTHELQREVVLALMKELSLGQIDIMGISYGGEVAIGVAAHHPGKVRRLILSNTAAYTNKWLKDIGDSWGYAFASRDGHQFFKTCIPIVYSPRFYEGNYAWASAREDLFVKLFPPEVYEAFGRLTRSSEGYDERAGLGNITAKTLVISSQYDYVTPQREQEELVKGIPDARHVVVQDSGHALMYEQPALFATLVCGFLSSELDIQVL